MTPEERAAELQAQFRERSQAWAEELRQQQLDTARAREDAARWKFLALAGFVVAAIAILQWILL